MSEQEKWEKKERGKFEEFWPNLQKCFTSDIHIIMKAGSWQAWLERARLAKKEIKKVWIK